MSDFSVDAYRNAIKWVNEKINEGFKWEEVAHLCVDSDQEYDTFVRLQKYEQIIPRIMDFSEWKTFVEDLESEYGPAQIISVAGLDNGDSNDLPLPTDVESAWVNYKKYLLGISTGKAKMSVDAVNMIEKNCYWILNRLKSDTRSVNPVKGLVMGSVQSGKTSNMIGLVTMAADYDWNVFIILSGTIENLRIQTRDRFKKDLSFCAGLSWHVMERSSDPDYMTDLNSRKGKDNEDILPEQLKLDKFEDGIYLNQKFDRYVFVCLKNSKRLQSLIDWLHTKPERTAKMRVIVIDDEADQASINTAKMKDILDEDEKERSTVNKLITYLVNGYDSKGNRCSTNFQAMNYICFTATPYANVLNEAGTDSLYPSSFVCSLPESKEYFGPKAIWGSKKDELYSGLNIVRTIPDTEMQDLKKLLTGFNYTLPEEFQKSLAWFLCAAAILRNRRYRKPISMLIHTTALQRGQFKEYDVLRNWLKSEFGKRTLLALCEDIYDKEKDEFRLEDLEEGYPEYARIDMVNDDFPTFLDIKPEICNMIKDENIVNIQLGEDKQFIYNEDGLHLCLDNCGANRIAEDGAYLRVIYPSEEELSNMNKAPVFIVMGGNTLSRGLTLEGLTCTYFARNVNQADTLMQMARWFGYRHDYELLQRIWMPVLTQDKFELLEEIDEKLKEEFDDFVEKGKSPSEFGPRVMSSSQIARFLLTAKNKSQNMIKSDRSGESYETTRFEDSSDWLKHNINITESFLLGAGTARKSDAIDSAYVWDDVDSEYVISEFINKYKIFECSRLYKEIPIIMKWFSKMNEENKFLKWNVALAGDASSAERWNVAGADVGKITRSRKRNLDYIDIGSLRSGRDILSDIKVAELSPEDREKFVSAKKTGKNLEGFRFEIGLGDYPLLLLYRIDKNGGQELKTKTIMGTTQDIIAFSIVVARQDDYSDYVKMVEVNMPDND